MTVEYNGEAEFPPIEQGTSEAARPARGDHRAAHRLPHVRRDADPDRARDRRAGDGVPAALHPRRPDRHQHDHADPRLDDRPRRRDRLLALHRHALPTAAPRGSVAARRRRRGRRVGRPRRALRRPDGRDLGHRPRVLRARLRHEARDRQRARRADDRADRELAAARGARAARPQDRPAEGAVPAADRRLEAAREKTLDRPLGPVRDAATRGSSSPSSLLACSRSRRRRRSSASAPPTRARSRRSRRPPGLRPARRGLRARLQRADPDRRRRQRRHAGAAADLRRRPRASRASRRCASRSSTTRRPSRSSS